MRITARARDGVELEGTLNLPARPTVPVPAVIAIHGAGSGLRTNQIWAHLQMLLTRNGIACLTWDRRGEGASDGKADSPYELLAHDVVSWFDRLATHAMVDGEKIALWGFSQGGWIGPLAAAQRPAVRALVSVSGASITPAEQMIYAARRWTRIRGGSAADERAVEALRRDVDNAARGAATLEDANAAISMASAESWFSAAGTLKHLTPEARDAWGAVLDLDIRDTLKRLRLPTLLVYGETDNWVPVEASLAIWRNELTGGTPLTIERIPGVGHHMRVVDDPFDETEAGRESQLYELALVRWLQSWLLPR